MAVRPASQLGSPVIRAKAKPATAIVSASARRVVDDLIDSMRHHGLVGMAAPQIGKSVRIFVTEIRKANHRKAAPDDLRVFINPRILVRSKRTATDWEGCGSVADAHLFGKVRRPDAVTVRAYDRDGKPFTLEAAGLLARIIQHEMDHLDGRVFTDSTDPKTYMSREEYLKMRRKEKRSNV